MKYFIFILNISFLMCANAPTSVSENLMVKEDSVDLHYVVRNQKDETKKAPVLMLLHGYGSNEQDLFSISSRVPEDWLVVSVRAPLEIGKNKYKWYDVQLVEGEITMKFEDEENSRDALIKLINQLDENFTIDKEKLVVAGFSQGANMSLGLALTEPDKVLGAGCFSGRFMKEIKPLITDKKALKSKKVFIAHGTEDSMLPMSYAEENIALLETWEMYVSFSPDSVAHTISNKQLTEFVNWLDAL